MSRSQEWKAEASYLVVFPIWELWAIHLHLHKQCTRVLDSKQGIAVWHYSVWQSYKLKKKVRGLGKIRLDNVHRCKQTCENRLTNLQERKWQTFLLRYMNMFIGYCFKQFKDGSLASFAGNIGKFITTPPGRHFIFWAGKFPCAISKRAMILEKVGEGSCMYYMNHRPLFKMAAKMAVGVAPWVSAVRDVHIADTVDEPYFKILKAANTI